MAEKRTVKIRPSGAKLTGTFLWMTYGLLVWAVHLTVVYGAHTVACARGATADLFGVTFPAFVVIAGTVVALAALPLGMYRRPRGESDAPDDLREEQSFERSVTNWLIGLAAFGIFWAGAGALLVSSCLALR